MTLQNIAQSNFNAAIDQQDSYESLTKAFEAYISNAEDAAEENGFDAVECSCIFEKLAIDAGHGDAVAAMWTGK